MAGKNTLSQNSANAIPVAHFNNYHTNSVHKNQNKIPKTSKELKSMTKKKLKSECRQRGQKTSGNKLELVCFEWTEFNFSYFVWLLFVIIIFALGV